nr:MAG TPA: hypothetical protein [Caudoviricetes sp.]
MTFGFFIYNKEGIFSRLDGLGIRFSSEKLNSNRLV